MLKAGRVSARNEVRRVVGRTDVARLAQEPNLMVGYASSSLVERYIKFRDRGALDDPVELPR